MPFNTRVKRWLQRTWIGVTVCHSAMTGVRGLPIERIAKKEIPFTVGLVFAVIVLTLVPEISLFLPQITGFFH